MNEKRNKSSKQQQKKETTGDTNFEDGKLIKCGKLFNGVEGATPKRLLVKGYTDTRSKLT